MATNSTPTKDVIEFAGRQYLLATSTRVDDRIRVLKHGDSFGMFDRQGDIHQIGAGQQGIFHAGTRYLSRMELSINQVRPLLRNSSVKNDNTLFAVDLTNPLIIGPDGATIANSTLHICRARILWQGVSHEQLRLTNYADVPIDLVLDLEFDADFFDIFEVRGAKRQQRGVLLQPEIKQGSVTLGYRGLDDVIRRTCLKAATTPDVVTEGSFKFRLRLAPHATEEIGVRVEFAAALQHPQSLTYDDALRQSALTLHERRADDVGIETSNEQFNSWLYRSQSDTHMLTTYTEHGLYSYAGIPWFSTPFGRDGIITALEYLWVNPAIARGSLSFLAYHQAAELNPEQEAEPGKILHEAREGEMATLNEVPFGSYYGSVDSTPLFVVLAGAYYERTGDLGFIEAIWPNLLAALEWIDTYGSPDGDGFLAYERHNPRGLTHQGWRDSDDSVFHADGRSAEGHIALCEVQGYVYAAKRTASMLAGSLGDRALE